MRKFTIFLCSLAMVFSIAAVSAATPISYDVNGPGSSVTLTNNEDSWFLGSASIEGSLVSGLDGISGSIDAGNTAIIPFFNLTVSSTGLLAGGEYNIAATLALSIPGVTAEGAGGGYYGSIAGIINGGTLNWNSSTLPDYFTLSDGTSFWIDFESGIALGLGDTAVVHAYLTNHGGGTAPVPEPATMLLLGTGLLGMVVIGRKRFKK